MTPSETDMVIGPNAAIKARVRTLIESMALKVRDPGASLTPAEIQLLGMASVPVYKIITVSAAAEFGISAQEINDLSEIVAVDLVTTMTMRFIDMAVNARSDFNGADADSLREWREGLYETRRNFLGIAARTSQRFDQTFALIQRTQMLEKTLRTQLSPQMSAALRFSRTLGSQVQSERLAHARGLHGRGGDYLVNTFNAIAAWTGLGGFKSLIRVGHGDGADLRAPHYRHGPRLAGVVPLVRPVDPDLSRADGPDRDGEGHRPRQPGARPSHGGQRADRSRGDGLVHQPGQRLPDPHRRDGLRHARRAQLFQRRVRLRGADVGQGARVRSARSRLQGQSRRLPRSSAPTTTFCSAPRASSC